MKKMVFAALSLAGLVAQAVPPTEIRISRADMPTDWPFTVESGVLACEHGLLIKFMTNGRTYAINGSADDYSRVNGLKWRDAREIWRDNPSIPGTKIPLYSMISKGQKLCRP